MPDQILLKPGPLTDEEWGIMRRHPEYVYQLLAPIKFLKPALDIPYCHREKWDGPATSEVSIVGMACAALAVLYAVLSGA